MLINVTKSLFSTVISISNVAAQRKILIYCIKIRILYILNKVLYIEATPNLKSLVLTAIRPEIPLETWKVVSRNWPELTQLDILGATGISFEGV